MKYAVVIAVVIVLAFLFNRIVGFVLLGLFAVFGIYTLIPNYYAYKGNVAFSKGDDDETLKWYEKAYKTGHSSIVVRNSYSFILIKTGNPAKAEEILSKILSDGKIPAKKRYALRQNRCMALYKLDRLDEALEEAEDLFSDYKNTVMYGMLGYFKIISGQDLEETLDFCIEAYEYNSDDRDILDNLSIVYYKLGDYENAKEISDKLIETAPAFIEAYYHGAQIADKCGDTKRALELLYEIDECKRSYLTTVSEQEIKDFISELEKRDTK